MMLGLLTVLLAGGLEVRWTAPPTCERPDLSLLTSENGRAEVTITTPSAATWVLDLAFVEPFQATRHLELGSCTDARRAARALLLLGLKGAEAFRDEPPPSPPPLTASEPVPAPSPPPSSLHVTLRAGALGDAFAAPAVTPRFLVAAAVSIASFEGELAVRAGLPATFPGGPIDGAAISVWPTLGAEVAACLVLSPGRLVRPAACGTVLAEWWQLRGLGVSDPLGGSATLLGAGGQLKAVIALGDLLELVPFLNARAHLRRPSARFAGVSALDAGALSLEAGLAVGLRVK